MRWSLRNQIFLPFAGLLTVSVILVTVVSAWTDVNNSRQQRLQHMEAVAAALGNASFPVTQLVVERIAAMIDGDVVVLDKVGQVTASTLDNIETLQPRLTVLASLPPQKSSSHSVAWDGREYLVTVVHRTSVPRPGTLFALIPQETFSALRRESILRPLMIAVPTLLLALMLAMLISGRIGRRVERLRELFRRLSNGDFRTVSVSGRNDEIRDLLCSANELSEQLSQLQLQRLRSERLQLLGQLSGGLAHQLRNSITGAKLAVQLHLQQDNAENAEMLQTAIAQLKLTEEQVAAVLSLRPQVHSTPQRQEINLGTLVDQVVSLLQPQSTHWNSEVIIVDHAEYSLALLASPASVKGAVLNIVLNAIQAAGIGGKVRIEVSQREGQHQLEVFDSGPGFEFDANTSLEAFMTTKAEGIGLGLTIAQHAVRQEHGAMTINRVDGWTSVKIQIPIHHTARTTVLA